MMVGLPRIPKSIYPVDMSATINRPYLLKTTTWTSAQAIRTALFSVSLPNDLLDIVNITDKLSYIQYIRPDMEIEVQINGTKFHYGRLIMCVQLFPETLDPAYKQPEGFSTWPEWYQISANSQQSVKISIPYRHIFQRIPMIEDDDVFYHYAKLAVAVSVPLSLVTTDTPPSLTVSCYARFVAANPEGLTSDITAQSAETEMLSLLSLGAVDSVTTKAMKVVGDVGSIGTSVSTFAKDVAVLASSAGLSVPVNPAPTNAMQIRQMLFNKANDMPNAVNLGPSQTAVLSTEDSSLVNSTGDDMDIVKIVSQPSLIYTGRIPASNTANFDLFNFPVSPRSCVYADYAYVPTLNTVQVNPQYYLGRMFKLWRGGMKFHISFVCSAFHSCRIRFVWTPHQKTFKTAYTNEEIGNSYNVVMDINKQTEYSIYVPFYPPTEWLYFMGGADFRLFYNGTFSLVQQTPLTSMAATVAPIYYQIFASMCEDAQFSCPSLKTVSTFGNPVYGQLSFLMAQTQDKEEVQEEPEILYAQSSETMMCELPSSSAACLRDTVFVNIAGDSLKTVRLHGDSNVFDFTSVKQLTNMLSPLINEAASALVSYSGYRIVPFGVNNNSYTDASWNNYYTQIRALFRFGRGSMRLAGISSAPNLQSAVYLEHNVSDTNVFYSANNAHFPLLSAGDIGFATGGYQYIADSAMMPVDTIIPYYEITSCKLLNSLATTGLIPLTTAATIAWSTQTTTPSLAVFLATADDFKFGVQIGTPYVRYI